MRCPACGSEERDGAAYCGMCKTVFAKLPAPTRSPTQPPAPTRSPTQPPASTRTVTPAPAGPLADEQWIRRDGARGQLDDATYARVRALCGPARLAAGEGRLDEANAQYAQALALLPGAAVLWDAGSAIHCAIGENHLRAGRYELARKHLAAAVQGHNGNQTPMFRWLLGEAEVELGALESAFPHLRDARAMIGRDRLAHRHRKYHGVADERPVMIDLADPPRAAEPPLHPSWQRRALFGLGGPPGPSGVLFVVYASYPHAWPPIRSRYRVPAGLELHVFPRGHELFGQWYRPPIDQLLARNPDALAAVRHAQTCVIVAGDVAAAADLGDLRRALGLVSAALPATGAAIYDAWTMRWRSHAQWQAAFADGAPLAAEELITLSRRGTDLVTGGLRAFGAPDLVMRDVGLAREPSARGALELVIDSFVQGATMTSGPIEVAGQRLHAIVHADRDNPYVENVWVELRDAGATAS